MRTWSTPTCGRAWGRRASASSGSKRSSATRSPTRCCGSRGPGPWSCTACPRIGARRSRTPCSTATPASCWTRPRIVSTPRRPSSWISSARPSKMPDAASVKRVVLAYSGGLDTSVILRWLIERYRCEVVAFCADLGQGEELIPIRDKALRTGARSVHVLDLREEFVRDFIFPMLRANAVYEGSYLLGTSIARPLIARAQVEIARRESADGVAHGATGKGNDQVRFELTYAALAPHLRVIAPWREWELNSRTSLIEFARRHDIPVPVTVERPYSTDRNLFHISYEGGVLEDPWAEPPAKMFQLTSDPEAAPDAPVTPDI